MNLDAARSGVGRGVSNYVQISLRETDDGRVVGDAPASDHLRGAGGAIRAGALLTMLDSAGGLCSGLAALPDGWVVTTHVSARTVRLDHRGPFHIEARVLRVGKNNVVAAVEIFDNGNGGAVVTDGVLTSSILIPADGPPQWTRPVVLDADPPRAGLPPFDEWLAARPIDAATLEIDLADDLRNPWGILHGGVTAALVDAAAARATDRVTTDVVLHFLAPNRRGPVRARATPLGTRTDGAVSRIEVVDIGADRVTALAVTTTAIAQATAPMRH